MPFITLDFETYYDKDYSLSKLTTEEYIRDDRFEVIGVSVKLDEAPAKWFSGTREEVKVFLNQFPWGESACLAHNTTFDGAILSWIFDIHPRILVDTLSMSRPLHGIEVGGSLAKLVEHYRLGVKGTEVLNALGKRRLAFTPEELAAYGRYCCNDTELTYKLFKQMVDGFPASELKLIDLTLKMFTEPVLRLDALLLETHLHEVKTKKTELLDRAFGLDPTQEETQEATNAKRKKLMSNEQFAQLLASYGVDVPKKVSPRTGKETYAFAKTDPGMTALLEHPDPDVQAIVSARLGVKSTIEETRTERFLAIANRGPLPIPLKYFAAHTSRWGGMDQINLQNLPSRGENAGKLKRAILPPPGYVIIDADSAQIEARILAWLAGQTDLVEAFARKDDVYSIMSGDIYRKLVGEINKQERFVGKTVILGCGYGTGGVKLQSTLKMAKPPMELSRTESAHIVDTYRRKYFKIPQLWKQGDACLAAMVDNQGFIFGCHEIIKIAFGMMHTPLGLPLKYSNLRRWRDPEGKEQFIYNSRSGKTSIWGGKLTENIVQHLARIIIGLQMIRIAKRYRVVMTVHDAIACIARKEEALEAQAYVEECMRWTPEWAQGLPLNCESGIGENYGQC